MKLSDAQTAVQLGAQLDTLNIALQRISDANAQGLVLTELSFTSPAGASSSVNLIGAITSAQTTSLLTALNIALTNRVTALTAQIAAL